MDELLKNDIDRITADALREDVGTGDLTGALIPAATTATATVITRQPITLAGQAWFDAVCAQVDNTIRVDWQWHDGDFVEAGSTLCSLTGSARAILTAERTALNFLQLISATATTTAAYVQAASGSGCQILDTRKTIPGLRLAQKYAVRCGGGTNHRVGLFDAILIKENHIESAGGIRSAINTAREIHGAMPVEIEVESLEELREALKAKAERLLLDNFSLEQLSAAVAINKAEGDPPAELEASGGVSLDKIAAIAATGVDYISVGALTKNISAVDLSLRFDQAT